MPKTALWTLGRIYLATVEKRMIQINYTTNTGYKIRYWQLCPYYFVFRNNNLYLVAWDPKQKKRLPLLAERIKNLIVLDKDQSIPWDIPPVQEVFKDALSVCDGNVVMAAKKLGIGYNTLYRKIKEYKIII